jgi:hypothetical protein
MIQMRGAWRVYFNRHGASPLLWCISPWNGSWEIALRSVILACKSRTENLPKDSPDDDDGKPSAWIRADGILTVTDEGFATIE